MCDAQLKHLGIIIWKVQWNCHMQSTKESLLEFLQGLHPVSLFRCSNEAQHDVYHVQIGHPECRETDISIPEKLTVHSKKHHDACTTRAVLKDLFQLVKPLPQIVSLFNPGEFCCPGDFLPTRNGCPSHLHSLTALLSWSWKAAL